MATIVAEIPNAPGLSTVADYEEKVDALSISERMLMTTAGGARPRSGRTVGRAKHHDIQLIRHVDIASPKLRQFCSAGTNLGTVKIHLFRSLETGTEVYFTYTLDQTYVSRIEVLTADDTGRAYTEHWGPGAGDMSPGLARLRVAPRFPVAPAGMPANREVEHVWFNAARVWWTYTPYEQGTAGGAIEKGWSIRRGREPEVDKPA